MVEAHLLGHAPSLRNIRSCISVDGLERIDVNLEDERKEVKKGVSGEAFESWSQPAENSRTPPLLKGKKRAVSYLS
jgi:hypothetical protein